MSFDHTESAYSPQNVFRGASIRGANFGRCRLTISLSSTRTSFAAQLAVVGPITASSVGGIARPRFVVNSRRKGKSCYCLHSMLRLVLRSAITGSERRAADGGGGGGAGNRRPRHRPWPGRRAVPPPWRIQTRVRGRAHHKPVAQKSLRTC